MPTPRLSIRCRSLANGPKIGLQNEGAGPAHESSPQTSPVFPQSQKRLDTFAAGPDRAKGISVPQSFFLAGSINTLHPLYCTFLLLAPRASLREEGGTFDRLLASYFLHPVSGLDKRSCSLAGSPAHVNRYPIIRFCGPCRGWRVCVGALWHS